MKLHRVLALWATVLALLASSACADEANIREKFAKKIPELNIVTLTKLPGFPLYEIVSDRDHILYTDAEFSFLIYEGSLFDTKSMENLTVVKSQQLEVARTKKLAFPFEQLPLDLAFKKVKGNGTRKLAVFSDPDCPYCKRLEQSLESIDNVTIYTFLYPLEQLHPKAPEIARAIWCSPDKVKAWDEYMLNNTVPKAAGKCPNPVERIVEFGESKRISGTPTLFFEDGMRVPGAIPTDRIEALLAKAKEKK